MNYPELNKRQLKNLADMASPNWANVPHAHDSAAQALKMKAALEMVLVFFHSFEPWMPERSRKWASLQVEAGREFPHNSATTKVLCDTIREVLGLQDEKMGTKDVDEK